MSYADSVFYCLASSQVLFINYFQLKSGGSENMSKEVKTMKETPTETVYLTNSSRTRKEQA